MDYFYANCLPLKEINSYDTFCARFTPSFIPKPHQIAFVHFCHEIRKGKGGILGDDMGLGKSISMLLAAVYELLYTDGCKRAIIWSPSSVLRQQMIDTYRGVFDQTKPDIKLFDYKKFSETESPAKDDKAIIFVDTDNFLKKLYTIGGPVKTANPLGSVLKQWDLGGGNSICFADEGDKLRQESKGRANNSHQFATGLKDMAVRIWVVTGTPFGTSTAGHKSLLKLATTDEEETEHKDNLQNWYKCCMMRRVATDPQIAASVLIPIENEYRIQLVPTTDEMVMFTKDRPDESYHFREISVASGTFTTIEESDEVFTLSEKEKAVVRICKSLILLGEQCTIAVAHTWVTRRMKLALLLNGIDSRGLTEKSTAKEVIMSDFRKKKFPVLLLQYMSGGRGINLQHCRNMIMVEQNYTAAFYLQMKKRIIRIGSPHEHCRIFVLSYMYTREDFYWTKVIESRLNISKALEGSDKIKDEANQAWTDHKKFYNVMCQKAANLEGKWSLSEHTAKNDVSMFGGDYARIKELGVTREDIEQFVMYVLALFRLCVGKDDTDGAALHIFTHLFLSDFRNYHNISNLHESWVSNSGKDSGLFKPHMTDESYYQMGPTRWLTDETINAFQYMLRPNLPADTYICRTNVPVFETEERLRSNFFKPIEKIPNGASNIDRLIMPWHVKSDPMQKKNHWICVLVVLSKKTVTIYDPKGNSKDVNSYKEDVFTFMGIFLKAIAGAQFKKMGGPYNATEWTQHVAFADDIQENGYDCGVYTIAFMRELAAGNNIDKENYRDKSLPNRMRMDWTMEIMNYRAMFG